MQATRITAIRHGETAWNVDTRIQGQLDIALNDKGRWQAERAGAALAGQDIAAVVASDLWRAYDTALSVAKPLGLSVVGNTKACASAVLASLKAKPLLRLSVTGQKKPRNGDTVTLSLHPMEVSLCSYFESAC